MKTCRECGAPESDFPKGFFRRQDGAVRLICPPCSAKALRSHNRRKRSDCYTLLGGSCSLCREGEFEFLTVDHVHGDGAKERLSLTPDQIKARILKDPSIRSRYRVLCRNCNDSLPPLPSLKDQSIRERNRRLGRVRLRHDIVIFLGGKCSCCPESRPNRLTVDHVHNDGGRSDLPRGGADLYKKILNGVALKSDFQLLCWNCNFSKHLGGGVCVHQRSQEQVA